MITVRDILAWLTENGYIYNSDGILDPEISIQETQRMIDDLRSLDNERRS